MMELVTQLGIEHGTVRFPESKQGDRKNPVLIQGQCLLVQLTAAVTQTLCDAPIRAHKFFTHFNICKEPNRRSDDTHLCDRLACLLDYRKAKDRG